MNIVHLLINAVAILIAAYLIPGVVVDNLVALIVLVIVLALINVFIKPIVTLLTLPINIVTLGLFSLVINALLVMLAGAIVPGFTVDGFWAAFFFAIVLSLVNALFGGMKK